MKTLLFSLILSLSFIAAQAAEISPKALANQQDAQALCFQQRVDTCINKLCQSKDNINCVKICKKTVKNECHYAGE